MSLLLNAVARPSVWALPLIQASSLQLLSAVMHPGFLLLRYHHQHQPCHMMADAVTYARRNLVPREAEVLHTLLGITSPTTSMAITSEMKLPSCLPCAEKLCSSLVKRKGKGNRKKAQIVPGAHLTLVASYCFLNSEVLKVANGQ